MFLLPFWVNSVWLKSYTASIFLGCFAASNPIGSVFSPAKKYIMQELLFSWGNIFVFSSQQIRSHSSCKVNTLTSNLRVFICGCSISAVEFITNKTKTTKQNTFRDFVSKKKKATKNLMPTEGNSSTSKGVQVVRGLHNTFTIPSAILE